MSYLLVIDDDEDFASAVAMVMRKAGHEAEIALDIPTATQSVKERKPDLIILDVMFPENTEGGFELARKMRHEDENLKKVPILMLTAVNARFPLGFSSDDRDEEWLPVDDFLEKPVDFDVLQKRVEALL